MTTPTPPDTASDAGVTGTETVPDAPTMDEHWRQLVSTALLGTDRREPPAPFGPIADLVDDTVRSTPSDRMLAQVAACAVVRRAGVLPGAPLQPLAGPPDDDRPVCVPAAADRWHHIVTSWPVLEEEWLLTVVANGWRVPPELVPALLRRHRSDPVRRLRAELACGPLATWLVEHQPDLAVRSSTATRAMTPGAGPHTSSPADAAAELADLPIPPELQPLIDAPGSDVGATLAAGLVAGGFGAAHRAVLVNVVARMRTDGLADVARALGRVDGSAPGYGLATVLADLADTRHRMLDELSRT